MFIDTHSHLYDEQFDDDRADVLQRAFAAGAGKIFLPNINAETIAPMLQLASAYPGRLYPMLGLHPEDLGDTWRETLQQMETLLQEEDHPYIAIGEVGLDYYWDRSKYEEQQEAFAIQVEWAVKYGLPLMIHTRDAHREMVQVLTDVLNRHPGISESRNIDIPTSRHPEILRCLPLLRRQRRGSRRAAGLRRLHARNRRRGDLQEESPARSAPRGGAPGTHRTGDRRALSGTRSPPRKTQRNGLRHGCHCEARRNL